MAEKLMPHTAPTLAPKTEKKANASTPIHASVTTALPTAQSAVMAAPATDPSTPKEKIPLSFRVQDLMGGNWGDEADIMR
jgi:hypothetical protein